MTEAVSFESLPKCLQLLNESMKGQINDSLSNDDCSSDNELIEHWTSNCGIPDEAANVAIRYRNMILTSKSGLQLFE